MKKNEKKANKIDNKNKKINNKQKNNEQNKIKDTIIKINKIEKIKINTTIVIIVVLIMFLIIEILRLKENKQYTYTINQVSDYIVYINENEFIDKKYLEKNQLYVSNMIDYIKINFEYKLKKNQIDLNQIKYNYNIFASLYIDYANTNQNLLKKDYEIIKDKYLDVNDENIIKEIENKTKDEIIINENININYDFYNNEVTNFKTKYNLPVKAYLKVYFIVDTNIELNNIENNIFIEKTISEVNIDLSQTVFEINENQAKKVEKIFQNTTEQNTRKMIITFILILLAIQITYLIIQVKQTIIIKSEKNKKKEIRKILKKYGDIIVELKEELSIDIENAIEVKNFDQILDVEEEIREPILFYETKDKEAVFLIVDHKITYKYIL